MRQPCLFNLRILRFSFLFDIFLWATSKYFSYNLSDKLAFHTPSLFKQNCLSIFIHEWQGWSQIPNCSWSFEAWNDCRRIEGVHRVTGRAKLRNLLWIWHSVAAGEGIFLFHEVKESDNFSLALIERFSCQCRIYGSLGVASFCIAFLFDLFLIDQSKISSSFLTN